MIQSFKQKFRASRFYGVYAPAARKWRAFRSRGRWEGWICEGREAGGQMFKFAYAGGLPNKNYVRRVFLRQSLSEKSLGFLPPEAFMEKAGQENCELVFFETEAGSPAFKDESWFQIPLWVPLKFEMESMQELSKRESLHSMRRRLRKNNFDYEFTHDPKKLKMFYEQFYVPFTSGAHEDAALIHPLSEFLQAAGKGELLLAYREGECAGGNLIEYSESEGRLSYIGIKPERIKEGAVSAVTFRAMMRVCEKNYRTVNLGLSRGFLNDGALRYKTGIGCRVFPPEEKDSRRWSVKVLKQSEGLKNVLIKNPLITVDEKGELWGAVFTESPLLMPESLISVLKETGCDGLKGLRLYPWNGGFDFELPLFYPSGGELSWAAV